MADPKSIQILDHIVADVGNIIETSSSPDYKVSVQAVHQPKNLAELDRVPPGDLILQVVLGDASRNFDLDTHGSPRQIAWDQQILIDCVRRISDQNQSDSVDKLVELLYADVVKCVMTDPQHGSLAIDTELDDAATQADDKAAIKTPVFVITYRHQENDPTI